VSQEIRAGIRLNLNDQFSPKLKTAGISMDGFKARAVGVAEGVGKAFSGLGGTLASVGVGIGAAALVREGITFQDSVTRIATSAGAFGDEADELGRRLLQVSFDARVPVQELVAFAAAAADGAVSIDGILENLPFMADVIQGVGVAGADAGQLLSLFLNRGADADTLREKLNDITEILARTGNIGIPELLRYLPSLLEESGASGLDGINDIVAAVSTLRMGTDGARQAIYQYRAAMRDFARPEVREAIWRYTQFDVGDADAGEMRGFAEIMGRLSELAERVGGTGDFREALHLSDATIRALRQYNNHFEDTVRRIGDLGDTSNAVAMRAAQNADTIQGSLNQLRAAASEFANATLMRPVERLASLLSQHPNGMRNAVLGLAGALTALAGAKTFNTVYTLFKNLKALKGGGAIGRGLPPGGGLGGGAPLPGGAGIPVFVTNMGMGGFGGLGGKKTAAGIAAPSGRMAAAPAGISQLSPVPVNDLIVTPGGTFSTHPDDYIMAMKRPTDLLGDGVRDEVRTVQHVIKETPPVTVDGEIVLRSELVIDDREYRLRQSVGKNTTPYRFAVGSAADARTLQ